jgi:hypothetical protein
MKIHGLQVTAGSLERLNSALVLWWGVKPRGRFYEEATHHCDRHHRTAGGHEHLLRAARRTRRRIVNTVRAIGFPCAFGSGRKNGAFRR